MHMVEKAGKFNLFALLASITFVVLIPFVFDMKTITSGAEYRGFPFDWLAIYPNNGFSFKGFGFWLNVMLFYLFINIFIKKLRKNVITRNTHEKSNRT